MGEVFLFVLLNFWIDFDARNLSVCSCITCLGDASDECAHLWADVSMDVLSGGYEGGNRKIVQKKRVSNPSLTRVHVASVEVRDFWRIHLQTDISLPRLRHTVTSLTRFVLTRAEENQNTHAYAHTWRLWSRTYANHPVTTHTCTRQPSWPFALAGERYAHPKRTDQFTHCKGGG